MMAMAALRLAACCAAAALLATPAPTGAARARRTDQDFEFDDDAGVSVGATGAGASRRPRRYTYEPHNALCLSLRCRPRELCVLRDADTALCAARNALPGNTAARDTILSVAAGGEATRDDEDDVFYDADANVDAEVERGAGTGEGEAEAELEADAAHRDRCVGCGSVPRAQFLCGSDNRTYSSLCRLDLHNCVRRARGGTGARGEEGEVVVAACRGFCPCRRRRGLAAPPPPPPRRPYKQYDDYEPRPAAAKAWHEREREQDSAHNEVLPPPPPPRRVSHPHTEEKRPWARDGPGCALGQLADRLLDWFSVLMDEAGDPRAPRAPARRTPPHTPARAGAGFPRACKPEVRWMFAHLDTDGDGLLSDDNLYSLRHDEREQCLRPFLASCVGAEGAGAGGVSRAAWCTCLRRAARPCTALARAHPAPHAGAYVPACDARGFYRARQCHPALGVCWCVTPHGVERPGSRTRGAPHCLGEAATAAATEGHGEGAGAPDDDEDAAAGSGDAELRF